jgi:hypothetical protein
MSGVISPLPQYAFMALCSVEAQGQLYLYLFSFSYKQSSDLRAYGCIQILPFTANQSCFLQIRNFCNNAQRDGASMSPASDVKSIALLDPLVSVESTFIVSTGVSNELLNSPLELENSFNENGGSLVVKWSVFPPASRSYIFDFNRYLKFHRK